MILTNTRTIWSNNKLQKIPVIINKIDLFSLSLEFAIKYAVKKNIAVKCMLVAISTNKENLNSFLFLIHSIENNRTAIAKYCLLIFIIPKNIRVVINIKKLKAMLVEYLYINLLIENRRIAEVII